MKTVALLIAGGVGNRMGQSIPKQFLTVNEKPVIVYTMEAFQKHPQVDEICVVCLKGWETVLQAYANQFNITKLKYIVEGGKNGQDSIRNGLFELEKHCKPETVVLIHDGIRPMVSEEIITDCIEVTIKCGNAVSHVPCPEPLMVVNSNFSATYLDRDSIKRTQTPMGFRLGDICQAHRLALEKGITEATASNTLMMDLGEKVYLSKGSEKNIKLTTVEDLDIFKALLLAKRAEWLK